MTTVTPPKPDVDFSRADPELLARSAVVSRRSATGIAAGVDR